MSNCTGAQIVGDSEDAMLNGGRLQMSSMYRRLTTPVPPDAPDRQYAHIYILILLGGLLFGDSCGNLVSLNWLDYVRELEAIREYSWGSATLVCLYSRVCHASRASTTTTGGPYLLLQIWAWERIPSIRPGMHPAPETGEFPIVVDGQPNVQGLIRRVGAANTIRSILHCYAWMR